jgi:hypothetical protein
LSILQERNQGTKAADRSIPMATKPKGLCPQLRSWVCLIGPYSLS